MIGDAAPVLAKTRRRLIPFLFLLYIVAYLDRINVGFAALQMNQALGFSPTVYGLGAGIFFLSYVLFEIPSNVILSRVGARIWIARIMISWGIVSSSMMLVGGVTGFYTAVPARRRKRVLSRIIYYLTRWFRSARARTMRRSRRRRVAGVIGGPPPHALFLTRRGSLAEWQ